jgi:hypothetical protein
MACLSEHGVDKLADVKMVRMAPDGQISVIRDSRSGAFADTAPPRRHTPA